MKTKEVKLYVQAVKWSSSRVFKIEVSAHQQKTCDYMVVVDLSEVLVEVPMPSVDNKQLTLAEVEQLRGKIKTERANSYARITAIEEKIQSLLCIEQGE